MTALCPNCTLPTDHVVTDDPTMFGCLETDCRVATFFPD